MADEKTLKRRKGAHLSKAERGEIEILRRKRYALKDIARAIGIVPSAIWYELKRRTRKRRRYHALYAAHHAYVKRKYARTQWKKITAHQELQNVVDDYLMDDQSPEHIAERTKRYNKDLPNISGRLIRRYIASPHGRRIEAHRAKFQKYRHRFTKRKSSMEGKRMIAERPKYINARKRIGDAEGDFMVSGKGGDGMILNVTDRKSRAPFFEKIFPVSIRAVERAFLRIQQRFPELKTLTLDNDILFVHYKRLERLLKIKIYFCFPGRPYEKGTNENRNKIVRQYIPKRSDISKISRHRIAQLEAKLHRRIMKCLQYRTPGEVLALHRKRKKQR